MTFRSVAAMPTRLVSSFAGILVCRASLGPGEACALPFFSKANASYLPPSEWPLANAAGSVTVTAGGIAAHFLIAASALLYGCRTVVSSLNVIPLDLFGPGRVAFSISLLGCAYSLMRTFVSPLGGASVDRFGFSAICVGVTVLPLVGLWVLKKSVRSRGTAL